MSVEVLVKVLDHAKDLPLPSYATEGAAGLDLMAAISNDIVIAPHSRMLIPTGIAIKLPKNYEAQVRPRSGLALKYGITVLNTPGTIDEDYRGEISVILINHSSDDFIVSRAMRIAQIIIAPVSKANLVQVDELDETQRGTGGFGSTGTSS